MRFNLHMVNGSTTVITICTNSIPINGTDGKAALTYIIYLPIWYGWRGCKSYPFVYIGHEWQTDQLLAGEGYYLRLVQIY